MIKAKKELCDLKVGDFIYQLFESNVGKYKILQIQHYEGLIQVYNIKIINITTNNILNITMSPDCSNYTYYLNLHQVKQKIEEIGRPYTSLKGKLLSLQNIGNLTIEESAEKIKKSN